jgi:aminopeptidase N
LKDVEGWRVRYERVRAAGNDKSLVFEAWNRPSSDDRALVYQKGGLVLHELREMMGDAAFWKGLRDYTRDNMGRAVATATFEKAMERAAKRSLAAFFDERVYLKTRTAR